MKKTDYEIELEERILEAIDIALACASIDGAHHKDWVIDQMTRALTQNQYDEIVEYAKSGEDGPETYSWEIGIAP